MATTRRAEPWSALLDAGRADGRLVREAFEGARAAALRADLPQTCTRSCRAGAAAGRDRGALHPSGRRRSSRRGTATTIVTTGTASGKSLCFNLPTLDVLLADPRARALYLYPTKALAQDQARALHALRAAQAVRPAIYDGDTPREERAAIRRRSNLDPDEPRHAARRDPPQPRARGATSSPTSRSSSSTRRTSTAACSAPTSPTCCAACAGSRRAYGTTPRFLLASATIANPVELAERLTGLDDVRADRRGRLARRAPRRSRCGTRRSIDEALQTRAQRARRGGRARRATWCARARGRSASSSRARRSS